MTWAGPGLQKLKMPGPGPSQDRNFFIAGAGPEFNFFYCRGRDFFYCRGRAEIGIFSIAGAGPGRDIFIAGAGAGQGSEFFFIAGAGPGFNFFYCRGRDFFYCRGRAGIKFFYCRGRGWAGIKIFEMTGAGAGPGL